MPSTDNINGHSVIIHRGFAKTARLRDEYYDMVSSPGEFVDTLRAHPTLDADLFTFLQPVSDRVPRFDYHLENDSAAVLQIVGYEQWWKKQINDKTRNMVRKAGRSGVEIREAAFCDSFVEGIYKVYNETPIRQGRRFRHYGKTLETIKNEHSTFLDRSVFIGAYLKEEMIGFVKLVHGAGVANLMQIISMISHRDKAPTNALIAKSVELCAARGIPLLHYGTWSRRSMGDFKKHHGFERMEIPRYYVPVTPLGALVLRAGLHRSLIDRVPEPILDWLASFRTRWTAIRYRKRNFRGAVAQLAERRS